MFLALPFLLLPDLPPRFLRALRQNILRVVPGAVRKNSLS